MSVSRVAMCVLLGSACAAWSADAHPWTEAQKRALAVHGLRASGAAQTVAPIRNADTLTVLHNFGGAPNDGSNPGDEVTLDATGDLYGTTDFGGSLGDGTLFEITPDGTESVLHTFGSAGDGSQPDGAVFLDAATNTFYGTTTSGGATDNGVIWTFDSSQKYKILHSFTADEGSMSRGRLIQDKKGNFYDTCLFGGANQDGTVIKFTAKGKVTILHTFAGDDGEFPEHGVVMDKKGNLYGVTAFGGASGNGSIYEIAKDGSFATLYSFTGGSDGGFPYGGLAIDRSGNLYGSAENGGSNGDGNVFELSATGAFSVIYTFTGEADGGTPEGDMLLMGKNLYSTNTIGGANGQGVVYEVTLKGKEKTLANFSNTNGSFYSAGLTPSGKNFFGTAQYGGSSNNGSVFSLTPK